jgi:hypothetical protein
MNLCSIVSVIQSFLSLMSIELGFSHRNLYKSAEDEEELSKMKEIEREQIFDERQKQ